MVVLRFEKGSGVEPGLLAAGWAGSVAGRGVTAMGQVMELAVAVSQLLAVLCCYRQRDFLSGEVQRWAEDSTFVVAVVVVVEGWQVLRWAESVAMER